MESCNNRQLLNNNDIISIGNGDKIVIEHNTFKVSEILQKFLDKWFGEKGKKWLFEGVECEVLAPGKPWRKGTIKVSFEFIPDEPESPLDDIRRDMEKYNS